LGASELRKPANGFGTETGTLDADSAPIDPDLAIVIDLWPELPRTTRKTVLATIQAALRK
jgi:hypothetical protein